MMKLVSMIAKCAPVAIFVLLAPRKLNAHLVKLAIVLKAKEHVVSRVPVAITMKRLDNQFVKCVQMVTSAQLVTLYYHVQ